MAGFTAAAKNLMLDQLGAAIGFVSLHTADPGTTGASEVAGGTPAYARKAVTWAAAANSSKAASNQPTFDVPPSTTAAFLGYWSAATGGTFYGSADITDETYAGQGTYTATAITLTQTP